MLDEGREVTDDAVIGKALQALVDEHSSGSTVTSPPDLNLGTRQTIDIGEFEQISRSPFEPVFNNERRYPGSFGQGLRRAERRIGENDGTSED
jgi:hypothetical protein